MCPLASYLGAQMIGMCITLLPEVEKVVHIQADVDFTLPGTREHMKMQGSRGETFRKIMVLRLLVSLSNQCLGIRFKAQRVLLRRLNSSGWMNGHPIRGLLMVVSLLRRLEFEKAFLQLLCLRQRLCSISIMVRNYSVSVVAQDEESNLGSVWCHVGFLFDSEA